MNKCLKEGCKIVEEHIHVGSTLITKDEWEDNDFGFVIEDKIEHPKHYTKHPSGVECIEITEHFNFNLGNVVKYVWRAALKGKQLEDLHKAKWYIEREIERLSNNESV